MNVSKEKRDSLLAKIKELKAFLETANATPKMQSYLTELETEVKRQKFGLVFEEHKEEIDEILETHTPVLTEDKSLFINNGGTVNFLIEGDNLSALKLLEKTHKGKVDVIYVDPPYNTGAKDWKYDNDYVDSNDLFRHSKWLSMMEKRFQIAKTLLAPYGVFICAIDENELYTNGLLLNSIFGEAFEYHCIAIVHNPGGIQGKNFSYSHEYAIFVIPKGKKVIGLQNRVNNPDIRPLRDVSTGSHLRTDAKNCFYPILIKDGNIIGFGDVCPDDFHPTSVNVDMGDGVLAVYPIDPSGNERKWVFARQTVEEIKNDLKVDYNKKRKAYDIIRTKTHFNYKTVWIDKEYNANIFGTKILKEVLPDCKFDFPKSLFTVKDCIGAVITSKDALYLDFFAGSGTTGHAVLELNKQDGGNRRFILCTNNENNICRDVTYERMKTVITGHRNDGSRYGESHKASLKYQKIEYLYTAEKIYYDYADELLSHIMELVELENGMTIDGSSEINILLNEFKVEEFLANVSRYETMKTIYLSHDISLSLAQQDLINASGITMRIIPEYYYEDSLI